MQGYWPSKWAGVGHKHTFTIYKEKSWSPVSINVSEFFTIRFCSSISVLSIKLIDNKYDYSLIGVDQTAGEAESAIEIIFRKRT